MGQFDELEHLGALAQIPWSHNITQEALLGAFSQNLRTLHFERHSICSKEFLQTILTDLEHMRTNGECLIMTSKSLQCLVLKFIEQFADHFQGKNSNRDFPEELKIMQEILLLLRESGYPIIDEADTVLNVLREVNFSSGNRRAPQRSELELLAEIYKILDALKTNDAITEKLFREKIQAPLVEALIKRLGSMRFSSASLTEKMHAFINSLTEEKHTTLIHYLCRDPAHMVTAQQFYNSLDEEVQDLIALAAEEISHLLCFSLSSYLEGDKKLCSYVGAFNDINISLNVLEWSPDKTNFQLLGNPRTDFHHVLIEGDDVTLLSQEEAVFYHKSPNYYNLTLGV